MNDKNDGAPKTDTKMWTQPIPLDTTVQPMNGKVPRGTSGILNTKSQAISHLKFQTLMEKNLAHWIETRRMKTELSTQTHLKFQSLMEKNLTLD